MLSCDPGWGQHFAKASLVFGALHHSAYVSFRYICIVMHGGQSQYIYHKLTFWSVRGGWVLP